MTDRKLTLDQLHRQLDETIEQVYRDGEQVVVERDGVAVAAVVPISQLEALRRARERFWGLIDQARVENAEVDPAEVDAAVEKSLREVRAARAKSVDHNSRS